MNKPGAEAGHIVQDVEEILRRDAVLTKNRESIRISRGTAKSLARDDAVGHIDAGLDAGLEIVSRGINGFGIMEVFLPVLSGEFLKLHRVTAEILQHRVELVTVNHVGHSARRPFCGWSRSCRGRAECQSIRRERGIRSAPAPHHRCNR